MLLNDIEYWKTFYKNNTKPFEPSSFSKFILNYLEKNKKLIELGCGNGRDSVFLSKYGLNVLGVDQVNSEIEFLNKEFKSDNLQFLCSDFSNLNLDSKFDYVYSRFTLHSIDENAENRVLDWVYNYLNKNGLFFVEARSINDTLYYSGTKISNNENFTDHYRRYMDKDVFISKLEKLGMKIVYSIESNGLAIHKDEDPKIVRIISEKII